jgi:DNA-directed RNA polymerase delta subunit
MAMTYQEIIEEIRKCDEIAGHLVTHHRRLKEELREIDQNFMSICKKKWLLEKHLIVVKKIPPGKSGIKEEKKDLDIKDLSKEQCKELFEMLSKKGV